MSDLEYTFDHVHIICSDLEASERWFVDKFGAELVRHRLVRGAPAADLSVGGQSIFLRSAREGEKLGAAGSSRFGTDHFGVLVKDLDATAQELKRRGVEFTMEPQDSGPGLRIAFVRGPDQVLVEVLQRG